ncbi:MAG TPA: SlyX family protein [Rhodanobacteraceae bacterium]|jgi:SlyX protein|nr:SlyX family protein [Rhodanobacteraceae bacterium]
MSGSPDQRLDEVETRLAFLDEALAGLNTAEAESTQRMLRIERTLAELRMELAALRTGLGDDVNDEPPPPHY